MNITIQQNEEMSDMTQNAVNEDREIIDAFTELVSTLEKLEATQSSEAKKLRDHAAEVLHFANVATAKAQMARRVIAQISALTIVL